MEILFVATELAPYAKVGGLGDVIAALPKALRMLGHRVTVVLPRYPMFEEHGLLFARRLTPLSVALGKKTYEVTVFDGRLSSHVDLVLVDADKLFSENRIYEAGEPSQTEAIRFALLSKAAIEIAKLRADAGTPFDVIHANDWPTALVPTFAKEAGLSSKTVLSIHNLAHQGVFPSSALDDVGLTRTDFSLDRGEFFGRLNEMKLGIVDADAVVTVSPTYAREIQTEAHGEKLDGVLRARGKIAGILNGVDYSVWNPATDSVLAARYDAEDTTHRARCRGALRRELGLSLEEDVAIVASIGRFAEQKGTDLLIEALPKLLKSSDAQFVIAGRGDPEFAAKLRAVAAEWSDRVIVAEDAPEAVVHRVFAAADLALVPSRFEPCGLVQMYAQRYGALPVARATGGLVDTIVDCDASLETGTGFLFEDATVDELVGATLRGIAARTLPRWPDLVRRVMRLDRGWERAARQYEQLYRGLTR